MEEAMLDDAHIHPADLCSDADLCNIETEYWTSDLPRFVHDMIATIRFLREAKKEAEVA
jgi:hypothetical protein